MQVIEKNFKQSIMICYKLRYMLMIFICQNAHVMKKFLPSFLLLAAFIFLGCTAQKKTVYKLPKPINDNYAFISMGYAYADNDSVSVDAFWMSKYEVTNGEFVSFLEDLKLQDRMEDYNMALPDTANWIMPGNRTEPYQTHYLRHPAYARYPVVNVNHEAAVLYCQWLTKKLNREKTGDYEYLVRLPSRDEWLLAAQGGKDRPYAWDTPYLKTEKGLIRANYRMIPNEILTLNHESNLPELIEKPEEGWRGWMRHEMQLTTPVDSYWPGVSGLYNMNGNVAEMIAKPSIAVGGSWQCPGYDIRNQAVMQYDNSSPFVGFRPVLLVKERE